MNYPQASRSTDPWTSHAAEREITETGQRQKQADYCLEFVSRYPGRTYRELAEISQVPDRNIFSRRLNDLRVKGRAFSPETRKCTISGRSMQVWYATPQQGSLI